MSHNWKNILVSSESSLRQVLKVIDNETLKLALVVDSKNMLLGTITDGDIRRALIKNISLNACVIEVMNRKPTVVEYGTPKHKLLGLMKKKELHNIHMEAWKNGVKSLYYCRSKSIQRAESNASWTRARESEGREPELAVQPEYEECLSCQ